MSSLRKQTAAIALISWSALSIAAAWLARIPWIVANPLILGVPLTLLVAGFPEARARLRLSFVVRYVVFVVVFFDYLCVRYGGWGGASAVPSLPGGVSVEQVTWTALFIPLALMTNEVFFSRPTAAVPRGYTRPILIGLFFGGFAVALVPPLHALVTGEVYLEIGLILYPPVFALALLVDRSIWREALGIACVFGVFNLAFELLALHLRYWTFEGRYLATVTLAGYRFPVEELTFLILLCAPAVVVTYSIYKNWKGMGASPTIEAPRTSAPQPAVSESAVPESAVS